MLVPRSFRESHKNAHGNSSFGWVELNMTLIFLNPETFGFLERSALYFRTEGVYLYSHCDTTTKSVGGIFMRRSLLQVQLYPVCSEAKQSFQCYPRWNCTFSCRTYSWISKIHCPALQRTKPKKWGVQPVIPQGLKSFQNIRIPKQTSSLSVCF